MEIIKQKQNKTKNNLGSQKRQKQNKQAGAELCQAQYKAKLSPAGVVAWLSLAKNNNRNSIR